MDVDPITLTVLQSRMESIATEMSHVLRRTAYSPNIKERADFSCAIFDNKSRLLAQAEAIPVHLGSMPFVAKPILDLFPNLKMGDAIVTNSPRSGFGGTHLPDITLLSPVFHRGQLRYLIANRAHHADVGGISPGSLPAKSTEIFQEGLIIPPVHLYNGGEENEDVMNLIMENVRTPYERRGDLRAQYSSLQLGVRRLKQLLREQPTWEFETLQQELLDRSERGTRQKIKELPEGTASFTDFLDEDGATGNPVKISCTVYLKNDEIKFDFTGSDPETPGNCNAPFSVTTSACYYVVRLLIGRDVPTNEGCFVPVVVNAPKDSVVNPSDNAATSSANTETSSRIVDVIMGAIGKIIPWPAASQGTMNNLLIGGRHKGKNWSIYETIGGGTGAGLNNDGTSAIHSHMTNTENTPVEALELTYPLLVKRYEIRPNSGGNGQYKGGNGIIREIELLDTATISIQSERRKFAPYGWGSEKTKAKVGKNIIILPNAVKNKTKYNNNTTKRKITGSRVLAENVPPHTVIKIFTPGGGGWDKDGVSINGSQ